jgi:hypothetical protein
MNEPEQKPGGEPRSDPPAAAGGGNGSADPKSEAGRSEWMRRAAADVRAGADVAAPVVRRSALRFAEWLGALSWKRFFLLAFLGLCGAGILTEIVSSPKSSTTITEPSASDVPVQVNVTVSPNGILIAPGGAKSGAPAPAAEPDEMDDDDDGDASTKHGDAAKGAGDHGKDAGNDSTGAGKARSEGGELNGTASLDDKGVHVVTKDDKGRPITVDIDDNGVHIEHGKGAGKVGAPVVLPIVIGDDPAKLNAAVETVRPKITQMVREEMQRRMRRVEVVREKERGDWIMSMAVLLILALVIVKLVLGSKTKAERQARVATATAVEEGLKRQVVEANLKMMQAQVEPHFLFNTLASVDYLIETDPARASKMQKNLIAYLRAALPQMREGTATLGKEVSLCRSYLEILKVRMEDRLQFALNVPAGLLSAKFPPMMLPTLVENAIKHGLEPKPEGGSLTVAADVANGELRVTVADTGLGFGAADQPGTGVGLSNIRERLAALYGGTARLSIEANAPSGTIVRIEVPYALEPAGATSGNGRTGPT